MLLSRLLLVLHARWRLGALVALGVMGLAAGITALLPRVYTASAAVVLDVKSPDPVAGLFLPPGVAMSSYMGTQVEILQSERVALKAESFLAQELRDGYRARWQRLPAGQTDYGPWIADQLLRTIDAKPGRDSNVLTISSSTPDRHLSAALANAFVQGYIETTLELKVEPARQYTGFFDQQSKAMREALEAAQARLTAFQRDSGITAGDERIDLENAKLADLATQFIALQGATSDTSSRVNQAGSSPDRMQEVLGNGVISGLTTDLARQEARLDELLARLGERHPQIQEMRANNEQLRHRIQVETERLVGSISASDSVNRARLLQARTALESQRSKVITLRAQRDQLNVLAKDVENAQRAFDGMFNRQSQSGVESQLTQTNVSLLKRASPPQQPSRPRTTLNLVLGATLGVLLGLGACVLREGLRPVLRTVDDLQADALQLPLLERLPALPTARPKTAPDAITVRWHPLARDPSLRT